MKTLWQSTWPIVSSFILAGSLFLIEQIFDVSYGWQTIFKWILLFFVPFFILQKRQSIVISAWKWSRKVFLYWVPIGIIAALSIILAYVLLKDSIDWSGLQLYLERKNISASTFLLVFSYIMFGNSLLEELFFRGWVFRRLSDLNIAFAYALSSLLFALYHLSIFSTWFSGWILLLVLGGLFVSGLLFSFLYQKTESIWTAWVVHIIADTSIVVIGYLLFFA